MKEELLQFVWENQLFNHAGLETSAGEKLEIINPGLLNQEDGPDFSDARIKVGSTVWAGNIEIHINASDWFGHSHHLNKKYGNVILHVVFNNDLGEAEKNRLNIPVFEISARIEEELLEKYDELLKSKSWIPCIQNFHRVSEITRFSWFERMAVERLEQRYADIVGLVRDNGNNWQESFYQYLARSFGFRVNNPAFFHLAQNTPLHIAAKHRDNLFQLEALLFGQAGFLDTYHVDDYPAKLFREYSFLKEKYGLNDISQNEWKTGRLRPGNFPCIRISQFASLLHRSIGLFSKLQEVENVKQLYGYFDVSASDYWNRHYVFDKRSKKKQKILSLRACEIYLILAKHTLAQVKNCLCLIIKPRLNLFKNIPTLKYIYFQKKILGKKEFIRKITRNG